MVVKKKTVSGYITLRPRQLTMGDVEWLVSKIGDGAARQRHQLEWNSGHEAEPGDDFGELEKIDEFNDLKSIDVDAHYALGEDYVFVHLNGASPRISYKGFTGQDRARQIERWWITSRGHARLGDGGAFAVRLGLVWVLLILAYYGLNLED